MSVLAIDPPLPELQATIVESPPPGAPPGRHLPPRRAVLAGVAASHRHRHFTIATPTAVHRRFRRLRRASVLDDCLIVFVVSMRI